jgi:2-dehydro-3-deoxygluconokinase
MNRNNRAGPGTPGDATPERPALGPIFVSLGEVMVRDTPADAERPERTRLVHLSLAGSEYNVAIGLRRLGVSAAFVTRVPDNPYGRAVRNVARENGVDTEHFVWAPPTEPIGRYIYERGRTPRADAGVYQRMGSAASRLGAGMVDWPSLLQHAHLLHTSGITLGLAAHSGYDRNHAADALAEALASRPAACLFGFEFNYRRSLWSPDAARQVLTPLVEQRVDVLIASLPDIAQFYGLGCGRFTPSQILAGEAGRPSDDDLREWAAQVFRRFSGGIVALTLRYPDTFEQHRWESAALDRGGALVRSAAVRPITLLDRLGGGDAWTAGFYYALLGRGFSQAGMAEGVMVGDACARLKQTLMFDLPILTPEEVQALIRADEAGAALRTAR